LNVASKAGGGFRNDSDALIAARRVAVLENSTTLASNLGYGGGLNNRVRFVRQLHLQWQPGQQGRGQPSTTQEHRPRSRRPPSRATSAASGGALYNYSGATFDLTATIVAGNTAPESYTLPDCQAAVVSGGSNLIGIGDVCTGVTDGVDGDQVGTAAAPIDPLLGPVQDNGGLTETMALLAGSPASDAAVCPAGVTTDQRGFDRPQGPACDVGAFENRAPTAGDPWSLNADEDETISEPAPGLLIGASDADGDDRSVVIIDDVDHGTLTVQADGSFTYAPDGDYAGPDGFTFAISDGNTTSGTVTVTITVAPVADVPSLSGPAAVGSEDTPVPLAISAASTDGDGSETLSITIAGLPAGWTLSAGSEAAGVWTLTPGQLAGLAILGPADANGAFTLTVTATAMETVGGDTETATISVPVTVNAVNDPPSFVPAAT
jgi:hypothetical protein